MCDGPVYFEISILLFLAGAMTVLRSWNVTTWRTRPQALRIYPIASRPRGNPKDRRDSPARITQGVRPTGCAQRILSAE